MATRWLAMIHLIKWNCDYKFAVGAFIAYALYVIRWHCVRPRTSICARAPPPQSFQRYFIFRQWFSIHFGVFWTPWLLSIRPAIRSRTTIKTCGRLCVCNCILGDKTLLKMAWKRAEFPSGSNIVHKLEMDQCEAGRRVYLSSNLARFKWVFLNRIQCAWIIFFVLVNSLEWQRCARPSRQHDFLTSLVSRWERPVYTIKCD